MERTKKHYRDLFFILAMTCVGFGVGSSISAYHFVCTGNYSDFFKRACIGILLGFLSASTHLLLLKVIDRLTRGWYRKRPILSALQYMLVTYLFLLTAELLFFAHRVHEPSHKYWIIAVTVLAGTVSTFLLLYYRLVEMILTRFHILEKLHLGMIESLIAVLEAREPTKKGHSKRVAAGCLLLAKKLKLPVEKQAKLVRAALMHDLGKIGIDDRLLQKESELDPEELAQVRLHPLIAEKILAPLNILSWETGIIKQSHFFINLQDLREKQTSGLLDNSLQSLFAYSMEAESLEELPMEAKILAVSDFFDTLTHPRPLKRVLSRDAALEELRSRTGTKFDREVVELLAFLVQNDQWIKDDAVTRESAPDAYDEAEVIREVRRTARGMNLLNTFYHYMGVGRHRGLRAFFLSLFSGVALGAVLGVTMYATTSESHWILRFLLQGIAIGLSVWLTGYPLEWLFARKYPDTFWAGPGGAFFAFFVGGIPASLLTLFTMFLPGSLTPVNPWITGSAYVLATSLICGSVGGFYRFIQDSSYSLIKDQERLQKAYIDLVCALSFALEAKDPYTRGHSEKVSILSRKMGSLLKLTDDDLDELEKAALFHDIGKLVISQNIINKTTRLSDDELEIIRTHPEIGAEILEPVTCLNELSPFVRAHHENFNGQGYPDRREKEEIPLFARIISIADSYDAMVSDRSYRKGLPHEEAINELRRCAGAQFDPELVELFIRTFEQ